MTELQLYKFIKDNDIENHIFHDADEDDAVAFIPHHYLQDFSNLIGYGVQDEGGVDCVMNGEYIVFHMKDICEYHNIDWKTIFTTP